MFDKERELSKLQAAADLAQSDFTRHGVRELFEHIMSMSRKKQYQLLTEYGKYEPTGFVEVRELEYANAAVACIKSSRQAAESFFSQTCRLAECADWREACERLKAGEVNFAFLPVQDEKSGYVSANYNLIAEYGFYILEEYQVEECQADRRADKRFLLISGDKVSLSGADKISICFEAPDECGSLYHLMSHLTYNNLNMNRIESIVISRDPLDYRFFIDLSGNLNDSAIKNAVRGLSDEARNFKIIGNYR